MCFLIFKFKSLTKLFDGTLRYMIIIVTFLYVLESELFLLRIKITVTQIMTK